jgi:hypothetical protein
MEDIRHDMSQYYPMKAVLEQLFGRRCYMKLKETADLKEWKVECKRLLRAVEVSIEATVEIADTEWRSEIAGVLELGRRHLASARSITSMFAHLSATLTRIVFLQIGQLPSRGNVEAIPVVAKNWCLNAHRSVQYIQTVEQSAAVARLSARRRAAPKQSGTRPPAS